MDSGFTIFCRVKFQFLLNKFLLVIWAYVASLAAVIRGALRDEMKRIQEKGASH